jgi:hypothetical protein
MLWYERLFVANSPFGMMLYLTISIRIRMEVV